MARRHEQKKTPLWHVFDFIQDRLKVWLFVGLLSLSFLLTLRSFNVLPSPCVRILLD
jgi:hypothetical protein